MHPICEIGVKQQTFVTSLAIRDQLDGVGRSVDKETNIHQSFLFESGNAGNADYFCLILYGYVFSIKRTIYSWINSKVYFDENSGIIFNI